MKKKKKRIGILGLFICIILICMFYSMRYIFLQEDLIFFQMFHSIIKSEKNSNNQKESEEIEFLVEYNHTKFKSLNLMETVHNKTLIYEKIAPGTSGNFNIVLKSKQNMQYMVRFESKNQKPSNLQFSITEKGKKNYIVLNKKKSKQFKKLIMMHIFKTLKAVDIKFVTKKL